IGPPASGCPMVPPREYVPPVLNVAPPPSMVLDVIVYAPPDCAAAGAAKARAQAAARTSTAARIRVMADLPGGVSIVPRAASISSGYARPDERKGIGPARLRRARPAASAPGAGAVPRVERDPARVRGGALGDRGVGRRPPPPLLHAVDLDHRAPGAGGSGAELDPRGPRVARARHHAVPVRDRRAVREGLRGGGEGARARGAHGLLSGVPDRHRHRHGAQAPGLAR